METKCFQSRERLGSHLGPFPDILKQFEEIEKKLDFRFFSLKVKEFSKDLDNSEQKKKLKTFFSKTAK